MGSRQIYTDLQLPCLNYTYRWMKLINTLTYFVKHFTIGLNN